MFTYLLTIDTGIGDTFSLIFWQYSIPILLSSGALVKSVSNSITVTERVKARTVVLHLESRYCYSAYSLTSCHCKL